MARYRNARIFAALLMLGSSVLSAQDSIPLGTRVRVIAGVGSDSRRIVGTLTSAGTAAWVLRLNERGDSVVVPTADLTEVRVPRGTRRHVLQGIAIGVLFGGILGAATYHEPSARSCHPASFCSNWGSPWSGLDSRDFAIFSGAVGGGLVGAAIGAMVKTDRWQLVNRQDLRLAVRPRGAGLGVGVSLRF
jgi:hypothetical protein